MIGNSTSSETGLNDNMRVLVFSEGVPANETKRMAALIRYTSGENEGKARQLARYFFGLQSVSASGHESLAVFPGRAGRQVSRNI